MGQFLHCFDNVHSGILFSRTNLKPDNMLMYAQFKPIFLLLNPDEAKV